MQGSGGKRGSGVAGGSNATPGEKRRKIQDQTPASTPASSNCDSHFIVHLFVTGKSLLCGELSSDAFDQWKELRCGCVFLLVSLPFASIAESCGH